MVTARFDFLSRLRGERPYDSGFSLVEILVVMAIAGVLFGLSWSAFYGMRTTMRLMQASENIKSDIVKAQRSAMFIKRDIGENWINGVGIDLGGLMDGDDELTYTIFKWCAGGTTYVDFDDGPFPQVSFFPIAVGNSYGGCQSPAPTEFVAMSGCEDILVSSVGMDFKLGLNGTEKDNIQYIVFESVTGMPHFFGPTGDEVAVNNLDSIQLVLGISERTNGVSLRRTGDIGLIPGIVLSD